MYQGWLHQVWWVTQEEQAVACLLCLQAPYVNKVTFTNAEHQGF
jgi:hypothetical protein